MNHPSDKTVLIVNDSPDQREMMQIIFEQAGYRTSTASEGREGFKTFRNPVKPFSLDKTHRTGAAKSYYKK